LVKTEGVTNRNWEGDQPGPLVTYRSIAGGLQELGLLLAAADSRLLMPRRHLQLPQPIFSMLPPLLLLLWAAPAGQVKYIWPIQTPVTDFDAQRKRVAAVREQLRWQLIGCELIECFQ
jgi:hypothetical protein